MDHPSEAHLAVYAVRSSDCGGRQHTEPDDPLRTPFELDRHRVVESTAFRRLERKTQVFAASHHDHFRTRLTHTLEAAQMARCLAQGLRANEALAEVIILAHDLGHPPFGHAGEAALSEAMAARGGFNHNTHALRVVDYLEHPFPAFRGLNLTAESRAGLATHATRYDEPIPRAAGFSPREQTEPNRATGFSPREAPTGAGAAPSVEAQIASIADRIAYDIHDLEDAIGAGLIGLEELTGVALWQGAFDTTVRNLEISHIHAIRRVVLDAMLDGMIGDAIETSRRLLSDVQSVQQVREATNALLAPSPEMHAKLEELERFLIDHVYCHPEIVEMDAQGRRIVRELFAAYRSKPDALPDRFADRIADQGLDCVICDYIAGMTDRFCTQEHKRITS